MPFFGQVSSRCTQSPAGLHAVTALACQSRSALGCSLQVRTVLTLLHHYHSGSSESTRRNLCVQALYKSKRLLHLHRRQCRWQEHISALRAAFACLSSITTSRTLCSCHHHPCVCACFVNTRSLSLQSWICLEKVSLRLGFFCVVVPLLQLGWAGCTGSSAPPAPPWCRASGLPISIPPVPPPGPRQGARRAEMLAHDEKWRTAWQDRGHWLRRVGSTTITGSTGW